MSHAAPGHTDRHAGPHVMSPLSLIATWAALMVLTIATVAAIAVDMGPEANLIAAMVVATLKAGIVLAFFMHLAYDKRFNFAVLAISVLCVILFVSLAFLDAGQYQPDIERRRAERTASS